MEAGYPNDWRAELSRDTDRIRRLRDHQEQLVAQAVAAGATWSAIASVMGVSRQSAHRRFRRVVGQVAR